MLEGLGEQERGVVVLQGPGHEPVAQALAFGGPAAAPPGPLDHGGDVEAAEPAVDLGDVAGQGRRGHPDALGQPVGHLEGRRGKVGGDEAEETQGAQLDPQPETGRRSPVRAHPAEVADVEGEVLHQVAGGDLGGPAPEGFEVGVGESAGCHVASAPWAGDHGASSASTAASRSASDGRL